ncbi:hemagglutinin repeat-containing protein, partial [Methylobacterium brachiatum]|uniref:hemagglutinin repeat-containing protein n=1 Tax=Methylobacterium brachiatum TaxID=269660 RepID=UPI0008F11BE2
MEQRLIGQALLDQTGSPILDQRYRNPRAQQEALYQGSVEFLQANPDIHLGDSLSAQQKASLTRPMLWYEQRTIDGQPTLAPQLILPPGRLADWTQQAGGVIQGNSVFLSGDQITNTGSLLASGTMIIDAGTFLNERRVGLGSGLFAQNVLQPGGVVSAGTLGIFTRGDLIDRGGALLARDGLTLSAGGNILIAAQAVTNTSLVGNRNAWIATASTINHGALVAAGGDLTVLAGGALSVLGSTLTAGGAGLLAAGGPITIASALDTTATTAFSRHDGLFSSSRTLISQTGQINVPSLVAAGGDLAVVSGSDITVKASHLVAGGNLDMRAAGSISVLAGEDLSQTILARRSAGLGLFGGDGGLDVYQTRRTTGSVTQATNAPSTLVAGGDARVIAGLDVNIVGSAIVAGRDLAITAGRDVTVSPGTDSRTVTTDRRRSGFGIQASLNGDTVSVGVGLRTATDRSLQADNDNVPAVLRAGRDLTVVAGRDITLAATDASAERDLRLQAGRNVNLLAALDHAIAASQHDRFFAGISGNLSSPLIGAGNTLAQAADGLGGRIGSESIAPTALAAYRLQKALSESKGDLAAGASASVTAGFEHSSSRMLQDSTTPVGTALRSGGSTTIEAEQGSLHAVGTRIAAGVDANGRPTGGPGNVSLTAGQGILLESAQATIDRIFGARSMQVGAGFDPVKGGPAGSAGYASDTGQSHEVRQVNSQVSGTGTVSLISGGDTSLRGATVTGGQIVASVGGDLTIESRF